MQSELPKRDGVEFRLVEGYTTYAIGTDGSLWTNKLRGSKIGSLTDWWEMTSRKTGTYILCQLFKDGEAQIIPRHIIVLTTFIGPCPEGYQACHKNDIRTDNRLENLYWGTVSQNRKDAYRNGKRTNNAYYKVTVELANRIRIEYAKGRTITDLSQELSVCETTIDKVVRNVHFFDPNYKKPDKPHISRGESHCRAKLDNEKVSQIREFAAKKMYSHNEMAKMFGVARSTIQRVIYNSSWRK